MLLVALRGAGGEGGAVTHTDLLPRLHVSICSSVPSDPELPAQSFPAAARRRGQARAAPSPPVSENASPKANCDGFARKIQAPKMRFRAPNLRGGRQLQNHFLEQENHKWDSRTTEVGPPPGYAGTRPGSTLRLLIWPVEMSQVLSGKLDGSWEERKTPNTSLLVSQAQEQGWVINLGVPGAVPEVPPQIRALGRGSLPSSCLALFIGKH